jgi:hypothetical protein
MAWSDTNDRTILLVHFSIFIRCSSCIYQRKPVKTGKPSEDRPGKLPQPWFEYGMKRPRQEDEGKDQE